MPAIPSPAFRLAALLLAGLVASCGHPPSTTEAASELRQAFPDGGASDAVRVAIAATESQDYSAGVIALETAKSAPGLTAAQLAAMEHARQAITSDLVRRADSGDAAAKAHLAAIERSRSQ